MNIDIFNDDAFSLTSLTAAINKAPHAPKRIDQMRLFGERGIATKTAWIEEREGIISLLQSQPRGGPGVQGTKATRKTRVFPVPHFPYHKSFNADEFMGVREFGTENQLQSVASLVQSELQAMRDDHDVTLEYLRMGAITGKILDGDGTTVLHDSFGEFGTTEQTEEFDFGTSTTKIRQVLMSMKRKVEVALGGATFDHIHGFAGPTWFDAYIDHADVRVAFERFQDGAALRNDARAGFEFAGVIIEEYRGVIGGTKFVADDACRFFPVGSPGMFITRWGPGTWMETVNRPGQRMLAKQVAKLDGSGIDLLTQSNPLCLCTRPRALVKGTQI